MSRFPKLQLGLLLFALAFRAAATTYYVNVNGTNPTPPYTDWSTAATNIQTAVDVSMPGDLILVTNGVYTAGGRTENGYALTNRVAITKAVTLESVNGPAVTVIQGNSPIGINAVRCLYITNGVTVSGFTLTNGATLGVGNLFYECSGGGVFCESYNAVMTNCILTGDVATNFGGGAYSGTLNNCTLSRDRAPGNGQGGGAFESHLNGCAMTANFAYSGGGAANSSLTNCTIGANFAISSGGGTANSVLYNCELTNNESTFGGGSYYGQLYYCTLIRNQSQEGGAAYYSSPTIDCIISNNTADDGGGTYSCRLSLCLVVSNSAPDFGGGTESGSLDDCIVYGNNCSYEGGGAYDSTLYNCTVAGNSAEYGGGIYNGTLDNCVIYDNIGTYGSPNCAGGTLSDCCTTPLPTGSGNLTNDPAFVNPAGKDFHLQSNSPCINSGNDSYVSDTNDLDGNPRIVGGTVDMGCYEYQTPSSVISYEFLQQYGLPTDGSVDFADLDGTAFNVYQDWIAGLNPTNKTSILAMLPPTTTNAASGLTIRWQSVSGIAYLLQRSTNLSMQPFTTIGDVTGLAGTNSYTDTTATNNAPYFYRVGATR